MRLLRAANRNSRNASCTSTSNRSARTPFACSITIRVSGARWRFAFSSASAITRSASRSARSSGAIPTAPSAPSVTRDAIDHSVDRLRQRALDPEDPVEPGDLEDAEDARVLRDHHARPPGRPQSPRLLREDPERYGVDEREPDEIDDHAPRAPLGGAPELLGEP